MKNIRALQAAVAASLLAAVASAQAALPTALTGALTEVETNIDLFETAMWPVFIAATLVFLYMKLGKRGINKL